MLAESAFISAVLISYTVVMTSRYGQTLGKMAAGVIVLDVSETRRPTFTQAWLRDIGSIAPQVLFIGYMAAAVLSGERDAHAAGFDSSTNTSRGHGRAVPDRGAHDAVQRSAPRLARCHRRYGGDAEGQRGPRGRGETLTGGANSG